MSIDSGAEALPRKDRRAAKRNVEGDIGPGLRKHITQAAKKIRDAHKAELGDVLRADRAGRLFSSIIDPNATPVGPLKKSPSGSSEGVAALAGELSALLSDAIRAGTALLEGSLTVLTRAWMTTVMEPPTKPNLEMPSGAGPIPFSIARDLRLGACEGPGGNAKPNFREILTGNISNFFFLSTTEFLEEH